MLSAGYLICFRIAFLCCVFALVYFLCVKKNWLIIESLRLERTFEGYLVYPRPAMSRDIFNSIRLLRAPFNLTLNVSRDGASPIYLGNLCQCFTTLISTLNLLYFSLKPLPLVLSLQGLLKYEVLPEKRWLRPTEVSAFSDWDGGTSAFDAVMLQWWLIRIKCEIKTVTMCISIQRQYSDAEVTSKNGCPGTERE